MYCYVLSAFSMNLSSSSTHLLVAFHSPKVSLEEYTRNCDKIIPWWVLSFLIALVTVPYRYGAGGLSDIIVVGVSKYVCRPFPWRRSFVACVVVVVSGRGRRDASPNRRDVVAELIFFIVKHGTEVAYTPSRVSVLYSAVGVETQWKIRHHHVERDTPILGVLERIMHMSRRRVLSITAGYG